MKKTALIIAAVFMLSSVFALSGCGNSYRVVTAPPSESAATPAQTAEPSIKPDEEGVKHLKNPIVTFEMESGGKIVMELYPDKAPNTVDNFVNLVSSGFYDGVIFHRVIPGVLIQGGDPEGSGFGGPGYMIKGEMAMNGFSQNDIDFKRGVLAMARVGRDIGNVSAYDTGGCQFFIMAMDEPGYNGDYTAFGKVTDGMNIVDAISTTPAENQRPVTEQKIIKATVETFGETYSEPEKIVS